MQRVAYVPWVVTGLALLACLRLTMINGGLSGGDPSMDAVRRLERDKSGTVSMNDENFVNGNLVEESAGDVIFVNGERSFYSAINDNQKFLNQLKSAVKMENNTLAELREEFGNFKHALAVINATLNNNNITPTTTMTTTITGSCTCNLASDTWFHKMYVDGVDVTSQISPAFDLGDSINWRKVHTITFQCGMATFMAVEASGHDGGNYEGVAIKCSATNGITSWDGMVANKQWKSWGGDGSRAGVSAPPTGWYLPSFDDSSWSYATQTTGTSSASVVGTPNAINNPNGKAWLLRSPKFG